MKTPLQSAAKKHWGWKHVITASEIIEQERMLRDSKVAVVRTVIGTNYK